MGISYSSNYKGVLIRALASVVLGVLLIIWTDQALTIILMLVGIAFTVTGIVTFSSANKNQKGQLVSVSGIASIVLGIVLILSPWFFVNAVIILLGVTLLLAGVIQFIGLSTARKMNVVPVLTYVMPALLVVLGVILVFEPWGVAEFSTRIAGCAIAFFGLSDIVSLVLVHESNKVTAVSRKDEEVEDAEYEEVK